jgi:hypothetical protein
MSYANPIDTRIVEVVLDDLQDNNHHTLCELLANAYGISWGSVPDQILEDAYQAALSVILEYRTAEREKDAAASRRDLVGS